MKGAHDMSDPSQQMPANAALLPTQALHGLRIGISVSDSDDLLRLGLSPNHFKLAVRELARTVLVGGGTLAYGGHLRPGGFTELLIRELGQYARDGGFADADAAPAVPLILCLAWQEHRRSSIAEIEAATRDLDIYGRLHCLDLDGQRIKKPLAERSAEAIPPPEDRAVRARALTAMRRYMHDNIAARMILGGKRHGYTGAMPGIVEEALIALEGGQPLYLAGGFGGITLDLAAAVDPQCAALCPRHASDVPADTGALAAIDRFRAVAADGGGWARLNNGLDAGENLRLAATHRPAEMAALIALGLGRWAQSRPAAAG